MQSIVTKPKPYPSGVRSRATTFGFCSFSVFTHTPPMCHYSQKPHRFRIKFRELPLLFSALVSSFVFLLVKKKITATCSKSSVWSSGAQKWPQTKRHTRMVVIWYSRWPSLPPPPPHTHTLYFIYCAFCNFALPYHSAFALYPNYDLPTFTCHINHSSNYLK